MVPFTSPQNIEILHRVPLRGNKTIILNNEFIETKILDNDASFIFPCVSEEVVELGRIIVVFTLTLKHSRVRNGYYNYNSGFYFYAETLKIEKWIL